MPSRCHLTSCYDSGSCGGRAREPRGVLAKHKLGILRLEHANTATQQVHVVEAFLKDDAGLENSMPLIVVVDH